MQETHMSTTSRTDSVTPARGAPAGVPSLDVDPFSNEFFEDPHAIHDTLREAGPLVWLDKWGVYGVARYAEVHAVLNDPLTFCSSRGVGLSDFTKEKPWRPPGILETDAMCATCHVYVEGGWLDRLPLMTGEEDAL